MISVSIFLQNGLAGYAVSLYFGEEMNEFKVRIINHHMD